MPPQVATGCQLANQVVPQRWLIKPTNCSCSSWFIMTNLFRPRSVRSDSLWFSSSRLNSIQFDSTRLVYGQRAVGVIFIHMEVFDREEIWRVLGKEKFLCSLRPLRNYRRRWKVHRFILTHIIVVYMGFLFKREQTGRSASTETPESHPLDLAWTRPWQLEWALAAHDGCALDEHVYMHIRLGVLWRRSSRFRAKCSEAGCGGAQGRCGRGDTLSGPEKT